MAWGKGDKNPNWKSKLGLVREKAKLWKDAKGAQQAAARQDKAKENAKP